MEQIRTMFWNGNFISYLKISTENTKKTCEIFIFRGICREIVAIFAFQWLQPSDRYAAPEHENFEKSSLRRETTAKMAP